MWLSLLTKPVSGASLAACRAAFGMVMLYEALWFLGVTPNAPRDPTVVEYWYTGPHVQWNFSLLGMEQIRPMSAASMHALFVLLATSAALVIVGLLYRVAIVVLASGFTYVILLEAAFYQNHFYLAALIAWLLAISPAHRCFAIDAFLWPRKGSLIPFWPIFLLRSQLFIVYFYAGVAKINSDWLHGEPLRTWLHQPSVASFLGNFVGDRALSTIKAGLASETVVWSMAYGGLVFDLTIGLLLVCRRTRLVALGLAAIFHGINFCLFEVGAFPVLAMGCTLIFLSPDWPLGFLRKMSQLLPHRRDSHPPKLSKEVAADVTHRTSVSTSAVAGFIGVWMVWQVLMPLRHYWIPGHVGWTEEGHAFSWRMMLRTKDPGPCRMEIQGTNVGLDGDPWQCTEDGVPRRYRQVTAGADLWRKLPTVLLTYEPLLGERIIFNPLGDQNWNLAAAGARQAWQAQYHESPLMRRTWPLREALLQLRRQVSRTSRPREYAELVSEIDLAMTLNDALQQAPDDPTRQQYVFDLQSALHRIASHRPWRKKTLELFMQTTPFALQGHVQENVPFMVIVSPRLIKQGRHCAMAIDRQRWQGERTVLIDFHRLSPLHMRSLPSVIVFDDFRGRAATFWNYSVDLHAGQFNQLRRSPRSLHQYAHRVARLCQRHYGQTPKVFADSYVKLNQHSLRPIVDSSVNLASVRWNRWTHNAWIMPFHGADGSGSETMEVSRTHQRSDGLD